MEDLPGAEFRAKMKKYLPDIGVPKISAAHERFLNSVLDADEILASMLNRELSQQEWEVLQDVMGDLMNYTKTHFVEEEAMLRKHGYADLNTHIAHHGELVEQLNEFQHRILGTDETIAGEVRRWLLEWFFIHVVSEDMAYKKTLNGDG